MPSNSGFLVPRPSDCPDCKGGRIGMAGCEKCGGTGTVFKVGGRFFPDTREGYIQAERALNGSMSYLMSDVDEQFIERRRFRLEEIARVAGTFTVTFIDQALFDEFMSP